jgi:hypothetical protein
VAKQGQHKHDAHDQTRSHGPNKPGQSQTITTGSYKKPETYARQARAHEDPGKPAQAARNEWNEDTRDQVSIEESPRARHSDIGHGRSGSDSNASAGTRGH